MGLDDYLPDYEYGEESSGSICGVKEELLEILEANGGDFKAACLSLDVSKKLVNLLLADSEYVRKLDELGVDISAISNNGGAKKKSMDSEKILKKKFAEAKNLVRGMLIQREKFKTIKASILNFFDNDEELAKRFWKENEDLLEAILFGTFSGNGDVVVSTPKVRKNPTLVGNSVSKPNPTPKPKPKFTSNPSKGLFSSNTSSSTGGKKTRPEITEKWKKRRDLVISGLESGKELGVVLAEVGMSKDSFILNRGKYPDFKLATDKYVNIGKDIKQQLLEDLEKTQDLEKSLLNLNIPIKKFLKWRIDNSIFKGSTEKYFELLRSFFDNLISLFESGIDLENVLLKAEISKERFERLMALSKDFRDRVKKFVDPLVLKKKELIKLLESGITLKEALVKCDIKRDKFISWRGLDQEFKEKTQKYLDLEKKDSKVTKADKDQILITQILSQLDLGKLLEDVLKELKITIRKYNLLLRNNASFKEKISEFSTEKLHLQSKWEQRFKELKGHIDSGLNLMESLNKMNLTMVGFYALRANYPGFKKATQSFLEGKKSKISEKEEKKKQLREKIVQELDSGKSLEKVLKELEVSVKSFSQMRRHHTDFKLATDKYADQLVPIDSREQKKKELRNKIVHELESGKPVGIVLKELEVSVRSFGQMRGRYEDFKKATDKFIIDKETLEKQLCDNIISLFESGKTFEEIFIELGINQSVFVKLKKKYKEFSSKVVKIVREREIVAKIQKIKELLSNGEEIENALNQVNVRRNEFKSWVLEYPELQPLVDQLFPPKLVVVKPKPVLSIKKSPQISGEFVDPKPISNKSGGKIRRTPSTDGGTMIRVQIPREQFEKEQLLRNKLIDLVTSGEKVGNVLSQLGISTNDYRAWRSRYPKFLEKILEAEKIGSRVVRKSESKLQIGGDKIAIDPKPSVSEIVKTTGGDIKGLTKKPSTSSGKKVIRLNEEEKKKKVLKVKELMEGGMMFCSACNEVGISTEVVRKYKHLYEMISHLVKKGRRIDSSKEDKKKKIIELLKSGRSYKSILSELNIKSGQISYRKKLDPNFAKKYEELMSPDSVILKAKALELIKEGKKPGEICSALGVNRKCFTYWKKVDKFFAQDFEVISNNLIISDIVAFTGLKQKYIELIQDGKSLIYAENHVFGGRVGLSAKLSDIAFARKIYEILLKNGNLAVDFFYLVNMIANRAGILKQDLITEIMRIKLGTDDEIFDKKDENYDNYIEVLFELLKGNVLSKLLKKPRLRYVYDRIKSDEKFRMCVDAIRGFKF